jgi:hypothetical protein
VAPDVLDVLGGHPREVGPHRGGRESRGCGVTPSATALLERLRSDRQHWQRWAVEDDVSTHTRYQAMARRDLLDALLQTLPRDLEAIEEEAAQEERGVAEWLDEGAGVA